MTNPTWIVMPAALSTLRALLLALGTLFLLGPAVASASLDVSGMSVGGLRGLERTSFATQAAATVATVIDDADERLKSGKRRCLRAAVVGQHNPGIADDGSAATSNAPEADTRKTGQATPRRSLMSAGATPDHPDRPPKIG